MWDTFLIIVWGFSTVLFGLITIYLFKQSNNQNKQLEFEEFSKKLNDSNELIGIIVFLDFSLMRIVL